MKNPPPRNLFPDGTSFLSVSNLPVAIGSSGCAAFDMEEPRPFSIRTAVTDGGCDLGYEAWVAQFWPAHSEDTHPSELEPDECEQSDGGPCSPGMYATVAAALDDRSPELARALRGRGEYEAYVSELANDIVSEIRNKLQALRARERWDDLPPMELVQNTNTVRAQIREQVLADMLEFPTDDEPVAEPREFIPRTELDKVPLKELADRILNAMVESLRQAPGQKNRGPLVSAEGGTDDPQPSNGGSALGEFFAAASSCATSLLNNADYMQKELEKVELPPDARASVESLCENLIGTKHDVMTELDELPEWQSVDVRVRRIVQWLGEDMFKLQQEVRRLEELSESDQRFVLAYILVMESATNMLRSFAAVTAAADRVVAGT